MTTAFSHSGSGNSSPASSKMSTYIQRRQHGQKGKHKQQPSVIAWNDFVNIILQWSHLLPVVLWFGVFYNSWLLYGSPASFWLCWSFGSCTSVQHSVWCVPFSLLPATLTLGMSLACHTGVMKVLCRVGRRKPQFPPSCMKPETAAAHGAVAILLTWQSLFLERVSSRDARYLFIVTFGFNAQAALCVFITLFGHLQTMSM